MSEENLPALIDKAVAELRKATTAAEILEAKINAGDVYDAAQRRARLAKVKDAHGEVVAACHAIQADALVIEAAAQIRLADEYDAAQERGEVKKRGQSKVYKKNFTPELGDIGLTKAQVHEARKIRDAEKANPGVVRKVLDEQLKAGKEPTRAQMKRAINGDGDSKRSTVKRGNSGRSGSVVKASDGKRGKSNKPTSTRKPGETQAQRSINIEPEAWDQFKASAQAEGKSAAEKLGELCRGQPIDSATLPKTAQEKLDLAIRQHKRALDAEFEVRVRDESRRVIEATILPAYNKEREEYRAVVETRKGVMSAALYRKLSAALHPDNFPDQDKKRRAENLFVEWRKLAIKLMDEKEMPTGNGFALPRTYDELMKEKEKVRAARAAARAGKAAMTTRA